MLTDVIYLKKIPGLTDHSPLMDASKWKENNTAFRVIKARPYDIENIELEIGVLKDIEDYDYAYIQPNGYPHPPDGSVIPRVYKIKAVRQGPTTRSIGTSPFPSAPAGTCILSLELDALATWYVNRQGSQTMYGIWERAPSRKVVEPFQIRPAQMIRDTTVNLPRMTETVTVAHPGSVLAGPYPIVFVKITGILNNIITTLYFVVPVDDDLVGPYASGLGTGVGTGVYPSLFMIMNFTGEITGISGNSIIDVSVSQCCPFEYTMGTYDNHSTVKLEGLTSWGNQYDITWQGQSYQGSVQGFVDNSPVGASKSESIARLVTAGEPGICQIAVKNAEGNIIHAIDPRFSEWDAVNSVWILNMTYTCYITTSAIVSRLTMSDGSSIEWSEGHLPYSSNRWNDYVLTERSYDREMNMIQRDKAQYDLATGALASLANGAFAASFSKGAAVGTAGLSVVGGIFDYLGGEMVRDRQQDAKDALMKATPNTVYSDAYGVGYLIKMLAGEHNAIVVMKPQGVTDGEVTSYLQNHGYPVDGYYGSVSSAEIATAEIGYIRCRKLTTALVNSNAGVWFRALDKQLRNGVAFRVYT